MVMHIPLSRIGVYLARSFALCVGRFQKSSWNPHEPIASVLTSARAPAVCPWVHDQLKLFAKHANKVAQFFLVCDHEGAAPHAHERF